MAAKPLSATRLDNMCFRREPFVERTGLPSLVAMSDGAHWVAHSVPVTEAKGTPTLPNCDKVH